MSNLQNSHMTKNDMNAQFPNITPEMALGKYQIESSFFFHTKSSNDLNETLIYQNFLQPGKLEKIIFSKRFRNVTLRGIKMFFF